MIYPLSVRRENDYLASTFGYRDAHPRFQWRWGEDLTAIAPVLDDAGKQVYDYHCACGINVMVHTDPRCNWSTPAPRAEKICIVPRYAQQWVMATWAPDPYLCYMPVGDPEKTLAIVPDQRPSHDDTLLIIAALIEHFSKSPVERISELKDRMAELEKVSLFPDQMGTRQRELYERIRAEAPVGLKDEYGRTTQWHGQAGIGPSPMVKLVQ